MDSFPFLHTFCFFIVSYALRVLSFLFCLFWSFFQLPAMPKKKVLSQAELEIHQVLSPDDSASTASAPTTAPPSQDTVRIMSSMRPSPALGAEAPQAPVSYAEMKGLFGDMTTCLVDAISGGFNELKKAQVRPHYSESEESESTGSEDEELPSEQPQAGFAPPIFGVNVNEPMRPVVPESVVTGLLPPSSGAAPVDVPGPSGIARPAAAPVDPRSVAPDPTLPLPSSRPPVNWHPDPPLLAWASKSLEDVEWTEDNRKAILIELSPDPIYDHLFAAVPMPDCFTTAIEDQITIDRDYLFQRKETEDFLFDGQKDLCCSSRLVLDVMSDLGSKRSMDSTDMARMREKLARIFHGMSSSMKKTSRGRRELARRFVPLEHAPAFYKKDPSHYCLFGFTCMEEATKAATEASAVNKDMVVMPKKTKPQPPFRGYSSGGKSFWSSKSRAAPRKSTIQKTVKGKFASGPRGRGRTRRGTRGRRRAKVASQE